MKIYSLKSKVVLLCVVSSLMISLIGSAVIMNGIETIVLERMEQEMKIIMENANVAISHLIEHDELEDIETIVATYTKHELIDQYHVCGEDLKTLYASDKELVGSVSDNMCVLAVHSGKTELAAHFSYEENVYEVAMPIESAGKRWITYAHLNSDYVMGIIRTSEEKILLIFNSTILIVMLMAIGMLSVFVLKPINKIKASTELVIADRYDTRIELKSRDEFQELAEVYNKMLDSIHEKNRRLEEGRLAAEQSAEERLSFLAHMSHEIRSPLNSIIGFTSLLLEKKTFKEDIKELKIIMKSCNHLLQIVNEIIDISKYEQETLTFESAPYNIRQLVYEVDGMFELLVPEEVGYTSEVAYNVPNYFIGDAYRIKEIMINLISNALKFTRSGEVNILIDYIEETLIVKVKDTGIGIPIEKQSQVFEAFTQSDESTTRLYGGSGLGLAISKRLALHMGGDLMLYSDGVHGTTFTLSLTPERLEDEYQYYEERGRLMVEKWLASDSLVRDIALDYIPTLIDLGEDLKLYYEEKNWTAVKNILHKVKGTTGHFNMMEIYRLVRDFEVYMDMSRPPHPFGGGYIKRLDLLFSHIPEVFKNRSNDEEENVFEPLIPIQDDEQDKSQPLRILIADDVLENRLLIRKILEKEHLVLEAVASGEEAIEEMKKTFYDCILLDIKMPGLSGEGVLKWIKDQPTKVVGHIITLTANARQEDQAYYMDLGSDDYLSKPIDKEELRYKIASLKR